MPDDAAEARRLADRAAGIGAGRAQREPRRHRRRRAARRAAGHQRLGCRRRRATGSRPGRNGLVVLDEPIANSSRLALPSITAPAPQQLAVTVALVGRDEAVEDVRPAAVVSTPLVQNRSLIASGMPSSGPRLAARRRRASDACGLLQRLLGGLGDVGVQARVSAAIAARCACGQLDGREAPSPAASRAAASVRDRVRCLTPPPWARRRSRPPVGRVGQDRSGCRRRSPLVAHRQRHCAAAGHRLDAVGVDLVQLLDPAEDAVELACMRRLRFLRPGCGRARRCASRWRCRGTCGIPDLARGYRLGRAITAAMPLFNLTDLRAALPRGERLIGLDPGSKLIGVALSDVLLMLASPYGSLKRGKLRANAAEVGAIARKEGAGGLVVGLPLDGRLLRPGRPGGEGLGHGAGRGRRPAGGVVGRAAEQLGGQPGDDRGRHDPRQARRGGGCGGGRLYVAERARRDKQSALDATRPAHPADPAARRQCLAALPGKASLPPAAARESRCPFPSRSSPAATCWPSRAWSRRISAHLLDLAESYALLNRSGKTQRDLLRGRTLINLFFEDCTRTRTSFELAGKRLGADVINMSVPPPRVNKGETLIDTAVTLNAMHATCWWSATPRPAPRPCSPRRSPAR